MADTAERLLDQLKHHGPQTAAALAAACGITPMGAHKQLRALAGQGLVDTQDEVQGVGRPRRIWHLTAIGHGRFPDRHGELAVQLVRQTTQVLGADALDRLIDARQSEAEASYRGALTRQRGLAAKVQALAALRNEEGYMARIERDGADWLLVEDHCPICAAATACQAFCRSELALFQRCFSGLAEVSRDEHLLAGARRCLYRLHPLPPAGRVPD
jgi:predicted ArsR family transcriptional regulator